MFKERSNLNGTKHLKKNFLFDDDQEIHFPTCGVEHPVNATEGLMHLDKSKNSRYGLSLTCESNPHLLPCESFGKINVSGLPLTIATRVMFQIIPEKL